MTVVDVNAARPVGKSYWQALRSSDVETAVVMYDGGAWGKADPSRMKRSEWLDFVRGLGVVTSAELVGAKWSPGSELVRDHRGFVCYAHDYEVSRDRLNAWEQLIICGEPGAQM